MKQTVTITVEGGVVQHVDVLPACGSSSRITMLTAAMRRTSRRRQRRPIRRRHLGVTAMPTYEIEQYELHVMRYRVEADNEADAIAKLSWEKPSQSTTRWSLSRLPTTTGCQWRKTETWRTNCLTEISSKATRRSSRLSVAFGKWSSGPTLHREKDSQTF